MTQLGQIISVDVDAETNGGFDQAPALVTGVYPDGSLRVRVFRGEAFSDTVRNYVDDQGEPFDADADAEQQQSAAASNAAQGIPPQQPVDPALQYGAPTAAAGATPSANTTAATTDAASSPSSSTTDAASSPSSSTTDAASSSTTDAASSPSSSTTDDTSSPAIGATSDTGAPSSEPA